MPSQLITNATSEGGGGVAKEKSGWPDVQSKLHSPFSQLVSQSLDQSVRQSTSGRNCTQKQKKRIEK